MIHDIPQPNGLFAGDLLRRANDFIESFDKLTSNEPNPSFSAQFLIFHGCELLLKAFLASQEVSKKEIRTYSHDLEKLIESATSGYSLHATESFQRLITRLNMMNRDHDFRYPTGYNLSVPPPDECLEVITPQKEIISEIVLECEHKALLLHRANTRKWLGHQIRWSD